MREAGKECGCAVWLVLMGACSHIVLIESMAVFAVVHRVSPLYVVTCVPCRVCVCMYCSSRIYYAVDDVVWGGVAVA